MSQYLDADPSDSLATWLRMTEFVIGETVRLWKGTELAVLECGAWTVTVTPPQQIVITPGFITYLPI